MYLTFNFIFIIEKICKEILLNRSTYNLIYIFVSSDDTAYM